MPTDKDQAVFARLSRRLTDEAPERIALMQRLADAMQDARLAGRPFDLPAPVLGILRDSTAFVEDWPTLRAHLPPQAQANGEALCKVMVAVATEVLLMRTPRE